MFEFEFDFSHLMGLENNVVSSIKTLFLTEISSRNAERGFLISPEYLFFFLLFIVSFES